MYRSLSMQYVYIYIFPSCSHFPLVLKYTKRERESQREKREREFANQWFANTLRQRDNQTQIDPNSKKYMVKLLIK